MFLLPPHLTHSGYASYAPTKYALRGLGDTLRNELCATGVDVCVAFPVDIDTPGYRTENLTKPPCCREISAATAPSSAEAAARGEGRGGGCDVMVIMCGGALIWWWYMVMVHDAVTVNADKGSQLTPTRGSVNTPPPPETSTLFLP